MIKIGETYKTTQCGMLKVIEKTNGSDSYIVEFVNTGTRKIARRVAIVYGNVKDPYAKLLCGVACLGNIKTKGKYARYYGTWNAMINRCYNPKDKRYNANRNVTVCDRWLTFENFYNDRMLIDGFDEEKIESGEYVLDKDYKQFGQESKVYSVDTCSWIDYHKNNMLQEKQQRIFFAKDPFGNIYKDFNITDFVRKHGSGLERRHISAVLHGRLKSTANGWTFSYEEIV